MRAAQGTYAPNETVVRALADKTIIMLVGPAAIGKSTVMNRVIEMDQRFHRAPSFTTRAPRLNDERGMYHYISTSDDYTKLEQDIVNSDVVQFSVSPVKDVVYGTYIGDYLKQFNLKDVWYSGVAEFEKLPFKNKAIVGLVASPDKWAAWMEERFQQGDPEALSRLSEAKLCLPWLIENKDRVKWVQNDDLEAASNRIIAIGLNENEPFDGSGLAQAMLDAIPELEKRFS